MANLRFKFRYWNGSKILNQEAIINHLNKYVARNDEHLMQYTGLKDKNGVEIYEGDIVAMESYGFLKVVTFIEKLAAFCVKSEKGESLLSFYIEDIEVIGNIYENPELINKGM